MGRYFFDLHNGDGPTRDEEGMELETRAMVAQEVSRILLDVARDEIPVQLRGVLSVVVRDKGGRPISVASLTFNNEWLD